MLGIVKPNENVGLCNPLKYEEHYMRIYVKDESKFKAALYAFKKTCKKFTDQFGSDERHTQAAQSIGSPMKERVYSSQRNYFKEIGMQLGYSQSSIVKRDN